MIVIITAMPIMIKIVIVMTIPEENKLISIENHFFLTLKTSQIWVSMVTKAVIFL